MQKLLPVLETGPVLFVLVVSADVNIRHTKIFMLEREGYLVQAVESRGQAEQLLSLVKFDAVILDHTLKRNDRMELVRRIRDVDPNTRILVLHKSGADCGADLHFDSREGPDALLSRVRMLLGRPA